VDWRADWTLSSYWLRGAERARSALEDVLRGTRIRLYGYVMLPAEDNIHCNVDTAVSERSRELVRVTELNPAADHVWSHAVVYFRNRAWNTLDSLNINPFQQ
jgi:hypothetical protein